MQQKKKKRNHPSIDKLFSNRLKSKDTESGNTSNKIKIEFLCIERQQINPEKKKMQLTGYHLKRGKRKKKKKSENTVGV